MVFKRPLLAIDISSSAVKLIEMRGQNDKTLHAVGSVLLPRGAITDGVIQNGASVEAALRELLAQLKIKPWGRRAAISLGGSSVIIKKVNFPNIEDENELADVVEVEAEQHFQHDLNDLYYSWHIPAAEATSAERTVILVGAKKELVDQHMEVVKAAGLKIGVVDCDVFAQANMFEYNFEVVAGLIALTHIGTNATQVSLIGNGQYLYTRDIAIGGDNYTKMIADMLSISLERAEALKIAASEGADSLQPEVKQAITRVNEQLVHEVQMTIDYFFQNGESPLNYTAVTSVFLAGGGCRTFGLDAAMTGSLHLPVTTINPFHRVSIPKRFPIEALLGQSHLYGVAVGLAMRDFGDFL